MTRSRVALLSAAALVCVGLLAPSPARAQGPSFGAPGEAAQTKTFAVVAVADYTRLMEDVDYLGGLVGMPQGGQTLRGMLTQMTGPNLAGLDKSRPLGVVLQATGFNVAPIICLPVSDEGALRQAATAAGFGAEDMGDGVIHLSGPGREAYIKAQGEWVYAAQAAEALSSLPSDPGAQFQELVAEYDLAIKLMAQDVPPMFKQMAQSQITGAMQQGAQPMPGETEEQAATRQQLAEASTKNVNMFLEGTDELRVGLAINPSGGGAHLDVQITAVEGSPLAAQLTALQPQPSRFGGFYDEQAAVTFVSSGKVSGEALPRIVEDAQTQFAAVRQSMETALEEEGEFPNPETKETVRSALNDVLSAVEAMVKSGRTDMAGTVRLAPDAVTLLGAFATPQPENFESALKKLAAVVEEDPNAPPIQWSAQEQAGVTFHTMEVPIPANQSQARQLLGTSLGVAVGVGQEAVYVAVGRDHMQAVTSAIDASRSGGVDAMAQLSISLKSIADFAGAMAPGSDAASAMMLSQAMAAAPDASKDHIRFSNNVTPGGLRYRITLEEGVIAGVGTMASQMAGQMMGPMMQQQ